MPVLARNVTLHDYVTDTEVTYYAGTTPPEDIQRQITWGENWVGGVAPYPYVPPVEGGGAALPPGGTTNQVLRKQSNADGVVEWGTPYGLDDVNARLATFTIGELGDTENGIPTVDGTYYAFNGDTGSWEFQYPALSFIPASDFDIQAGAPVYSTNGAAPRWTLLPGDKVAGATFRAQYAVTKLRARISQVQTSFSSWTLDAYVESLADGQSIGTPDVLLAGTRDFVGNADVLGSAILGSFATIPGEVYAVSFGRGGSGANGLIFVGLMVEEGSL